MFIDLYAIKKSNIKIVKNKKGEDPSTDPLKKNTSSLLVMDNANESIKLISQYPHIII